MSTYWTALANGAIASALITAVVWLVLRFLPRRIMDASARYAIWWIVLVLTATLPLLHIPQAAAWHPNQAVSYDRHSSSALGGGHATPIPNPAAPRASTLPQTSRLLHGATFPIRLTAGRWAQWLAIAWLIATMLMLIRILVSYVSVGSRKARASMSRHLDARLDTWLRQSGTSRKHVRVALSSEITAPLAAGIRKPAILIPTRLHELLLDEELDQIGLHELAHLSRRDDYALLLQRIVEALLALHPVVHWIGRNIDLEREMACDDMVIVSTGRAQSYAGCLARVAELTGGAGASGVVAAATERRSHLEMRIESLLNQSRTPLIRWRKAGLTLAMTTLLILAVGASTLPNSVVITTPPHPIHLVEPNRTTAAQIAPHQMLAQQTLIRPTGATQAPARLAVRIVRLFGTVTDPLGRFVTGLVQEQFKIVENDVEQQISEFSSEDAPLSSCIVVDNSAITAMGREREKSAIAEFLRAANTANEFCLVEVQDQPHLINSLTTDFAGIQKNLLVAPPRGRPALHDGIAMAINELKNGNHLRKALLVVSGGDEYNSHYSQAEIINAADDAHVPIYSVVIFDSQANPSAPAEATAADLEALADITGGRYLTGSLSDPSLALTVARFGIELRNAYVLAYRPKNATGAVRLHVVKVDVTPIRGLPPLEAKFQPQYYYASSQ